MTDYSQNVEGLFDAERFIKTIRENLGEGGFGGKTKLTSEAVLSIKAAAKEVLPGVSNPQITKDDLVVLMERFEEMCRRQNGMYYLTFEMRVGILKQLAKELELNHRAMKADIRRLFPFTLRNGALCEELKKEFPLFADPPSDFTNVLLANPIDPRSRLIDKQKKYDELLDRSKSRFNEFACFSTNPREIKQAVIYYSDPEKYLRNRLSKGGPKSKGKFTRPVFGRCGGKKTTTAQPLRLE
jgi:hypothetical protein